MATRTIGDYSRNLTPTTAPRTSARTAVSNMPRVQTATTAKQQQQKRQPRNREQQPAPVTPSTWDKIVSGAMGVLGNQQVRSTLTSAALGAVNTNPQLRNAYTGILSNPAVRKVAGNAALGVMSNPDVRELAARAGGGVFGPQILGASIGGVLGNEQTRNMVLGGAMGGAILNAFGINTKQGQYRGTSARSAAMATPTNVKQGRTDVPLYGYYDQPAEYTDTSGYGYGGYGGYRRGGGGGRYGGGGYTPADYERWLRELLARWNI